MCWCQARLDRTADLGRLGTYTYLMPYLRQVRFHQLFLADLPAPRDLIGKPQQRRHGVGHGAPGMARKQPPPVAGRPDIRWIQQPLLDAGPRDYQRRIDLRNNPQLDNPWLAWALHLAHRHAEAHGFATLVAAALNRALVMVLADHAAGENVKYTDIHRAGRGNGYSAEYVAHVLRQMDILVDDRVRPIEGWIDRQMTGVAPAVAAHVRTWAIQLLDGGPRAKPRSRQTTYLYIYRLRPVLLAWAEHHDHLREITRDVILQNIQHLHGHERNHTIQALRHLFRWAKTNGVVFRDPTYRIKMSVVMSVLQPLQPGEIAPSVKAATTPQMRLAIALAAVHAARTSGIRAMQLSDVDLGNRRLTIAGHTRPLDELTHFALADWLDHRQKRWPNTANQHLLISAASAIRLGPVGPTWLNRLLRNLPATLERLRIDRQLDEAIISGADPLHLTAVFGISDSAAIRYAAFARKLLQPNLEDPVPPEPTNLR